MLTLKSICVAQVSFELIATLLPQLHEYWDYRREPEVFFTLPKYFY